MIEQTYSVVWDLDRFFEGGSSSPSLRSHLDEVKGKLSSFDAKLKDFKSPTSIADVSIIEQTITELKDIATNLSEAGAVIGCFMAQDTTDKQAALLEGEVGSIYARLSSQMLTI